MSLGRSLTTAADDHGANVAGRSVTAPFYSWRLAPPASPPERGPKRDRIGGSGSDQFADVDDVGDLGRIRVRPDYGPQQPGGDEHPEVKGKGLISAAIDTFEDEPPAIRAVLENGVMGCPAGSALEAAAADMPEDGVAPGGRATGQAASREWPSARRASARLRRWTSACLRMAFSRRGVRGGRF